MSFKPNPTSMKILYYDRTVERPWGQIPGSTRFCLDENLDSDSILFVNFGDFQQNLNDFLLKFNSAPQISKFRIVFFSTEIFNDLTKNRLRGAISLKYSVEFINEPVNVMDIKIFKFIVLSALQESQNDVHNFSYDLNLAFHLLMRAYILFFDEHSGNTFAPELLNIQRDNPGFKFLPEYWVPILENNKLALRRDLLIHTDSEYDDLKKKPDSLAGDSLLFGEIQSEIFHIYKTKWLGMKRS